MVVEANKKSSPDTMAGWYNNSLGLEGSYALDSGAGWSAASGPLSAFSVVGR